MTTADPHPSCLSSCVDVEKENPISPPPSCNCLRSLFAPLCRAPPSKIAAARERRSFALPPCAHPQGPSLANAMREASSPAAPSSVMASPLLAASHCPSAMRAPTCRQHVSSDLRLGRHLLMDPSIALMLPRPGTGRPRPCTAPLRAFGGQHLRSSRKLTSSVLKQRQALVHITPLGILVCNCP
jgi:hypothetical protein